MKAVNRQPVAVVEDNDEEFEALSRAFARAAPEDQLVRFETGEQALSRLQRADGATSGWPALLLLDLNLPGLSGLDVLSGLRTQAATRALPVVVVSGSTRPEDIDGSYERGANAYVVKPLGFRELERVVAAIHGFWQLAAALPTVPAAAGTPGPLDLAR